MTDRLLLDNVTLSKMTPAQRSSPYVRDYCRVPTPVLFEAQGLIDAEALDRIEYETTIGVLSQVTKIVNGLEPGDRLLDLYRNEGNGDVFLLAVGLVETNIAAGQMFGDDWVIATDDVRLAAEATRIGITTCTSTQFIYRLG
jgi:hypothetical protein